MTTQAQSLHLDKTTTTTANANWRSIYRIGGVSALVIGLLLIGEMSIYLATSAPSLADAAAWFHLFQSNRLVGLLDFGILELYGMVLFVPVFLALYAALRRASESLMAVAIVLALTGIAANFATSRLFPLLTLSDLYAAAPTAALKAQFLAAGQATLALGAVGGISGGAEGGVPLAVGGLIMAAVMLRSNLLGRLVGLVGILANGTGLAMYLWAAVAPNPIGSPFFLAFFLLTVIWFALIAARLLRLNSAA